MFLLLSIYLRIFFFSSRRRHTRSKRDWSSDVCSSDIVGTRGLFAGLPDLNASSAIFGTFLSKVSSSIPHSFKFGICSLAHNCLMDDTAKSAASSSDRVLFVKILRSEERRVGKECRSR